MLDSIGASAILSNLGLFSTSDEPAVLGDHLQPADGSPVGRCVRELGDDGLARPAWASVDPLLRDYYDTEWGIPVVGESAHFERLALEGFQSGLSWAIILRKRPAFREVFAGFDPDAVAAFDEEVVEALMADARIIRNRRKIEAACAGSAAEALAWLKAGNTVDAVKSRPMPSKSSAVISE